MLVLLATAAVAHAQAPPVPEDDPFYAVPGGIAGLANGTVLGSRAITAYAGAAEMPATAWQVKYKTLDNQGGPTATVTTLMVPDAPWTGSGPRPLVSYQVAEDGVGGKCSASYALRAGIQPGGQSSGNAQGETAAMRLALERGFAVAAPDYEGPQSAFLGPEIEARGTLDGVRAALRFKPAGLGAGTPIALWGYSGGSVASAYAAQQQRTYAPDLRLSGIALGGLVPDVRATLDSFEAIGGGAAAVLVGLIGLDRAYPGENLRQYLNEAGRQAFATSQRDCLGDAIGKYAGRSWRDFAVAPDVLERPAVAALLRRVSPLHRDGVPAAPVYDYHGTDDELAPIGPDRAMVERWCAAGVTVEHVEHPGEHFSEVAVGTSGALDFLAARFAGKPTTTTCPPGERPATTTTAGSHARSAPAGMKLRARRIARRVLRLTGRLVPPSGVACRGRVVLRVRAGGRTLATRRPALDRRSCRFAARVVLTRARLGRHRFVRVTARVAGSAVRARSVRVRAR